MWDKKGAFRRAAAAILLACLGISLVGQASAEYRVASNGDGGPTIDDGRPTTATQPSVLGPRSSVLVVRVYFRDFAERDRLAVELNAHEVPTVDGYLTAVVERDMYEKLLAHGLKVEIDEEQTRIANDPHLFGETFFGGYRTVEEMEAFLDAKVAAYPTLAEKVDIGDSWCKTHPGTCTQPSPYNGYDLLVLHITNQAIPGPKPVFWFDAGIHSREIGTPEMAMRYIDWLLDGYNSNPDARWLVDYHDIWIMPMLNPDGHHIVEAGGGGSSPYSHRKNADKDDGCTVWPPTSSTQFGTDLNRNFPFLWNCCGGSSNVACEQTYRGPTPSSEEENAAVVNKIRSLIPDQRGPNNTDVAPITTTGVYQSMHSVANLNLYPWGWTTTAAPNNNDLRNIARHMSAINAGGNGYTACQPPNCLYVVDGASSDWGYGELGIPSFTTEISGGSFFPTFAQLTTIYNENQGMLIYLSKIARTPYLQTRGPDANNVVATHMTVTQGTSSQLSGTINYAWTANSYSQTVAAAEYYLDTPPWAGGSPVAMAATDGTFSGTTEAVQATIDTTSLALGRHLLFVRGRGVNSYSGFQSWGPISAAFLDVLAPGPTPTGTPPTVTPTRTNTPANTPTNTRTSTPTRTPTRTNTPANTPTNSHTNTPTATATSTPVPPAVLVGHVLLEGKPNPPDPLWSVPVTLSLQPTGGGVTTLYPATTDNSGYFTVTAPGTGIYDWWVKNPQALANTGSATLAAGTNPVEMGTLRTGDIDDSNCVDVADFNLLVTTFGRSSGDPGYDARADLDGSNTVDIADFNLLKNNFGICGAPALAP